MLRARSLEKTYPGPAGTAIPVLRGVDLDVKAVELAVIAGASGSGKSTLLNVLGLLEDADSGRIWFGDLEVTTLSRNARSRARGRHLGFVFQSFQLLPSLTALDNVLLAARYVARRDAATTRRALALLETFGVAERRHHYPAQLSGGEQQRVAYCRAVLNEPPILLADEPTGNLDDANAAVILRALRERADAGGAVVVVSHRADVMEVASWSIGIEAGHLVRRAA